MSISIKGVDKVALLRELVNGTNYIGFFLLLGYHGPAFSDRQAREDVKKYIDYYCGKPIKCDLSGDTVNPAPYDRDAGPGAFARCVDRARKR